MNPETGRDLLPPTRVVYATDFSPDAEQAFPKALEMAEAARVPLETVHVIESPSEEEAELDSSSISDGVARMRLDARRLMYEFTLKGRSPVTISQTVLRADDVSTRLQSLLKERGGGLLVIGAQGQEGRDGGSLGRVAEAMSLRGVYPTMTVPARARKRGPIRKVLVAVSQDRWQADDIEKLGGFARGLGAQLAILPLARMPSDNTLQLRGRVERDMINVVGPVEIDQGAIERAADGVLRVGAEYVADLIIVPRSLPISGRSKHEGFARSVAGSAFCSVISY